MSDSDRINEFMREHGAKREFYDEGLKFRYKNKDLHEFTASIYGLDYREFPPKALISEPAYLQWCAQISNMIPTKRGKDFLQYIRDRLTEAEEEEIPPNMEEGAEVENLLLCILKNQMWNARNFDKEQENQELISGEWMFMETADDSKCGLEVYIKLNGFMAGVTYQKANGNTETKLTRKEVVAWLRAHGRCLNREATVNRRRSAYVLPYEFLKNASIFSMKQYFNSHPKQE
jgi:hypothetical protein